MNSEQLNYEQDFPSLLSILFGLFHFFFFFSLLFV